MKSWMRLKFWAYGVVALALAVCALPASAQSLSGRNYWTGNNKFQDQVNVAGGWKVGTTGALISNAGAATLKGIANTGTLVQTGAATINGNLATTGTVTGTKSVITITTSTVLTAAQCKGTLILLAAAQDNTTITVTMPTLVAGYDVRFNDIDNDSGAGLVIQMGTGDKVNGGTAAKKYKHVGTATTPGAAHFIAVDATDFVLQSSTDADNWSNDNS